MGTLCFLPGTRFELVTLGFSIPCSNQLSYPGCFMYTSIITKKGQFYNNETSKFGLKEVIDEN